MSIGEPYQNSDGTWMVPTRAENADGTAVGFGWAELTPEHPMYEEWMQYIRRQWVHAVDPVL